MSHQRTGNKSVTEIEFSQKNDRELAAVLRAVALSTQDPSPIFKLNVDCWEDLFDWLSVTDLHSFGQTCKFFHRIAGKYFEWKYKRVLCHVYPESMSVYWKDLDGFNEFAQRLSFYDCDPDKSFLYALANCKLPVFVEIVNARSTELDINRLENMLARVESLKFSNFYVPDEFIESFVKFCAKSLKRLRIDRSAGYGWMHNKYEKLQHLELSEFDSFDELIEFFERNPNVRSFSTIAANILKYRNKLMASNIKLDDLTILRNTDIDVITSTLIDLHQQGLFKRLHFKTETEKHLADLPGLTTLHVDTYNYIKMPDLPTVTGLVFQVI